MTPAITNLWTRLLPWRQRAEAAEQRTAATEGLVKSQARRHEVEKVAGDLRRLRAENHFASRIEAAMRRG